MDSIDKALEFWSKLFQALSPAIIQKSISKFRNIEGTLDLMEEVSDLLGLLQENERQTHLLKVMLEISRNKIQPDQHQVVTLQVNMN